MKGLGRVLASAGVGIRGVCINIHTHIYNMYIRGTRLAMYSHTIGGGRTVISADDGSLAVHTLVLT